jgi:hypothetical protein
VRRLIATVILVAAALPAAADDPARRADVEAIVPVLPYEHERLHYFDRRDHHLVPGTVTIDRAPYLCDLDQREFVDQDEFVAHLRSDHRTPPQRIPDLLVVRHGRVHFVGE